MGTKENTTVEDTESTTLVDFLYIDRERLDSFISQFTIGTLRSVTKTNAASESSFRSGTLGVSIAKGSMSKTDTSNIGSTEQYDPFYSQLFQFLNSLPCTTMDSVSPDVLQSPRIMTVKGTLVIRDSNSLAKTCPVISKNPKLFGLTAGRDTQKQLKGMGDLFSVLQLSINMELTLSDSTKIAGPIKESGLQIKISDIIQQYGANLPGSWYVFGIFDFIRNHSRRKDDGSLNDAIDSYQEAISQLGDSTPYKVIPIVVYRPVTIS